MAKNSNTPTPKELLENLASLEKGVGELRKGIRNQYFAEQAKQAGDSCPPATQDIQINLENRQNAIDNVGYGPLNPAEPNVDFWDDKADRWNISPEQAKTAVCGNCIFFIRTPSMLDCIEEGIGTEGEEARGTIDAGEVGYCNALDFKCASERTCNAWAAGGPVTEESQLKEQEQEKEAAITAAAGDPCWDGYKQVGMKKGDGGKMVPNCVPVDSADDSEDDAELAKKKTGASTPAPKSKQKKGSSKNPKGSASGGKKIKFSKAITKGLKNKVEEHNEKHGDAKGKRANLRMLKAVFRRGAGAYSTSHRPGKSRNQWSYARVNAFLKLLRTGKPSNKAYTQDNDLLPASHPRSTKKDNAIEPMLAGGMYLIPEERDMANAILDVVEKHGKFDQDGDGVWAGYTPAYDNDVKDIGVKCSNCVFYQGGDQCAIIALKVEPEGKCRFAMLPEGAVQGDQIPLRREDNLELLLASANADAELTVADIPEENNFETSNEAIKALTEFSDFGYDAEFAIRASWLRAVKNGEDPYRRARMLAMYGTDSIDSDLLPKGIDGYE
jgi:hypothetical protein